ncbi:MAG TPA: group 1 truncated hemoglobin [Polyangiaceae bacterium]
MAPSLYDRIGGEPAIMAAVDLFYEKVKNDEVTRPFFDGLDMNSQVQKQIAFMSRALGGPVEYHGKDLRVAHARLVRDKGLGDAHFDAVATHLRATLEELGVQKDLVEEALTAIAGMRDEVLGR